MQTNLPCVANRRLPHDTIQAVGTDLVPICLPEGILPSELFTDSFAVFNRPDALVTLLGPYLSQAELLEAHGLLSYVAKNGIVGVKGHTWQSIGQVRKSVRTTRTIMALNTGRVWARKRLVEQLSPMLHDGITIAVVPSHDPFRTDTPIRRLAQALAQDGERSDATACLVRHTKINRIVFGGKSTPRLHKETINVQKEALAAGKRVLLLDDIRKSGASLRACRNLLYEAGAAVVQAARSGRGAGLKHHGERD